MRIGPRPVVSGTLGVVITAHRQGRIADPRQVLLELRSAGMWLSDEAIARALRIADGPS